MSEVNRELARAFLSALGQGQIPEELLSQDMTIWTLTSGTADKQRFLGGIRMLAAIFGGSLVYTIDSLTAEEDRVAAEVQSRGTLVSGEQYHNTHVFTFRMREGRIAAVAEYMNQTIVREKIIPLLQAAVAQSRS